MEELLIQRVTFDGAGNPQDNSDYLAFESVGDTMTVFAGAPGTGKTIYRITRIDAQGLWGKVIYDSVRILKPSEVR